MHRVMRWPISHALSRRPQQLGQLRLCMLRPEALTDRVTLAGEYGRQCAGKQAPALGRERHADAPAVVGIRAVDKEPLCSGRSSRLLSPRGDGDPSMEGARA